MHYSINCPVCQYRRTDVETSKSLKVAGSATCAPKTRLQKESRETKRTQQDINGKLAKVGSCKLLASGFFQDFLENSVTYWTITCL